MADSFIPLTTGEKLQTFRNTVGANSVDAEAVTLVSSAGAELFPTVVSSWDHAAKSSIGTSAVQISSGMAAKKAVTVKASRNNTGTVYLGNSDVTAGTVDATDGIELFAGESVTIPVNNANLIYAIASIAGQKVFFLVT